eukprot:TRINITY_DN26976_c0_g1_i1.p1 TRINITY_DN26976_c0_g1~~TRINITY_DN26976_c0_g1_i1.p1  ORF type:complete len:689 (+),score=107.74 TRINITY_DN26976_c0_g1_i1:131-2068(+)
MASSHETKLAPAKRGLSSRCLDLLQRALLPRLLSCSLSVFSPSLDPASLRPNWIKFLRQASPAATQGAWHRATEASWACRLDSVSLLLLRVAQTAVGAALLADQRCFVLLAYCPLLQSAVLSPEALQQQAYVVPYQNNDAIAQGVVDLQGRQVLKPTRRALHTSWCRVLLLVATMLASAPQLISEAEIFLQVYAVRFRYVFQTGLQTGQMAVLEEAALMCRVLAFMCAASPIAQSLMTEGATQALVFVIGSCLTERSTPSEVFLPVSADERIAAQVGQALGDNERMPAQVPSVFHQRVEYLGLDLLRHISFALLRITSSPTWLSEAGNGIGASSSVALDAPGWPSSWPSVFGLRPDGGDTGVRASRTGDPMRQWAALMDVTLEGARKVVEILTNLHGQAQEANRLLIAGSAKPPGAFQLDENQAPWMPLSLALVGIQEISSALGPGLAASGNSSPSNLALGLTPVATPCSPSMRILSPSLSSSGQRKRADRHASSSRRSLRYKFAVRRPHATLGGQMFIGVAPEGVSIAELCALGGSILELSCTLLSRFCQVTRSSNLGAGPKQRSSPGAAVLHGLLTFLHELLDAQPGTRSALDDRTVDYLDKLAAALHAAQSFGGGEVEALQQSGFQPNPAFDGDAWVLGGEP